MMPFKQLRKLDLSDADIVKIFKERKGLSDKAIRLIMSGKFNPVTFFRIFI
jgi:hypothetical protein